MDETLVGEKDVLPFHQGDDMPYNTPLQTMRPQMCQTLKELWLPSTPESEGLGINTLCKRDSGTVELEHSECFMFDMNIMGLKSLCKKDSEIRTF